jgi:hypothetical protein
MATFTHVRHAYGAHAPVFAKQTDDAPASVALLHVYLVSAATSERRRPQPSSTAINRAVAQALPGGPDRQRCACTLSRAVQDAVLRPKIGPHRGRRVGRCRRS